LKVFCCYKDGPPVEKGLKGLLKFSYISIKEPLPI